MNRIDLEKFIGAALGTLVFVFSIGFLSEAVYHTGAAPGGGYTLPEPEEGEVEVAIVEEEAVPLADLLVVASAENGIDVTKKCTACHSFDEGGANKVGPALYDVVGRTVAAIDGFSYSDVLNEMGADGIVWTYEALDAFLADPKAYAPGTKMGFAGLRKEEDRADLLAYMQTLSQNPVPFPAAEDAALLEQTDVNADATSTEEIVKDNTSTDEEAAPAEQEAAPAAEETTSTEETSTEETNN